MQEWCDSFHNWVHVISGSLNTVDKYIFIEIFEEMIKSRIDAFTANHFLCIFLSTILGVMVRNEKLWSIFSITYLLACK